MQSIAIIPAAGHSRRMGQAKLLLPWRGRAIIDHVLDAWRGSRVSQIVMVIRADDDLLAEAARRHSVALVKADPAPEQMKDSVALGLAFAREAYGPGDADVWLLAPADMPRLSPQVIGRVLQEHDPHEPRILVPRAGDKNGHPVLFPWPWAAAVAALGPTEGINVLRERYPCRQIDLGDRSTFDDLDTPDDYRALLE